MWGKGKNKKRGKKPIILSQSQLLFRHLSSPQLVSMSLLPSSPVFSVLVLVMVPSLPSEEVIGDTGDEAQFTVVPLCQSYFFHLACALASPLHGLECLWGMPALP